MKKLLSFVSVLSLSLSLLIPTNTLATSQTDHNYTLTLQATNAQQIDTNQYLTTLQDKNGEEWEAVLNEDQTGQKYIAHIYNYSTETPNDDIIFALDFIQPINSLATSAATNNIILHVNQCNYDNHSKLYIAETMDEIGDIYTIQSLDDISNQWLSATINSDYEIMDYKIMN